MSLMVDFLRRPTCCIISFVVVGFLEVGSGYIIQIALKLLGLSDPHASASQVAGTIGMPLCSAYMLYHF